MFKILISWLALLRKLGIKFLKMKYKMVKLSPLDELRLIFYYVPAERKRRAEEAHQSANVNGRSAEINGGPTVSFVCFLCLE